jgi:hypothetical protein
VIPVQEAEKAAPAYVFNVHEHENGVSTNIAGRPKHGWQGATKELQKRLGILRGFG